KSAGKGNTLLLSTRQFVRITSFCSFEPDKVQQFRHAPRAFGTIQPAQAKANVFLNSKVGKQCVILEHHANAAMFRFKLKSCAGQYLAVQYDAAGAQRLEAGNGAQYGSLAATRGTQQAADMAFFETQRKIFDHRLSALWRIVCQRYGVKLHDFSHDAAA